MFAKLTILLAALGLASLVVFGSGLASLQAQCVSHVVTKDIQVLTHTVVPCSSVYMFDWFLLASEFILLVCMVCTSLQGTLPKNKTLFTALYTITTLLFACTPVWMHFNNQQGHHRGVAGTCTVVAGAILTALMNAVILAAIVTGYSELEWAVQVLVGWSEADFALPVVEPMVVVAVVEAPKRKGTWMHLGKGQMGPLVCISEDEVCDPTLERDIEEGVPMMEANDIEQGLRVDQ